MSTILKLKKKGMKNMDFAIISRETIASTIKRKQKVKFSRQVNHVRKSNAKLNHKGYLRSASQFFIIVLSHRCRNWWELVEVRLFSCLASPFILSFDSQQGNLCFPLLLLCAGEGEKLGFPSQWRRHWVMCRVQPRKEAHTPKGLMEAQEIQRGWDHLALAQKLLIRLSGRN